MSVVIRSKVSYHGGDADQGYLEIYDAGVSIHGFARALAITSHALLNDGAIRRRAERAHGAEIRLIAPRRGSFEWEIVIALSSAAASGIGTSVAAAAFWDMVKWTWSKAIGGDAEPHTPHVRRLARNLEERDEPHIGDLGEIFIGEMSEALEVPLEQAHRPIRAEAGMRIIYSRPRVGPVVRFDQDTLDYVSSRTETDEAQPIVGNVTRYNVLSGFGRLYDDEIETTVSFKVAGEVPGVEKQHLTWSLHEFAQGNPGKLTFDVVRVVNRQGLTKRYIVHGIRPTERLLT